ncbi:MAG: DEAD/DEAH box helicase [bacterium]|nr:DEAD/DEAH box helicase [bacterium]MDN5835510.1 DEAD/DEAH box helicase [bacterium]
MYRQSRPGDNRRTRSPRPNGGSGGYRSNRSGGNRGNYKKNTKSNIDYRKFINKAIAKEEDTPYVPENTFHDFKISPQTLANLDFMKFTTPSEIQDRTIGMSIDGKDVIGLANTGTGKTAAFLLPIITKLTYDRTGSGVLILAPTRELAQQIDAEFKRFSAGQKLFSALLIGGANIGKQIQQLKRNPQIIIGTPGRVQDLIRRKALRLSSVHTFVLDEADRMCDMGFEKDIRGIEAELPKDRQTLCYSATMTPSVRSIVAEFMRDPEMVSVVRGTSNEHIEQDVVYFNDKEHKIDTLIELLEKAEFEKVIIFGETKFGVQRLADRLSNQNLPAVAIHGNKSQSQREKALHKFKKESVPVNVLVATDVAARGLDIPNVSHVINFDAPKMYDDYVHRIGRTGRAGKSGIALTFIQGRKQPQNR